MYNKDWAFHSKYEGNRFENSRYNRKSSYQKKKHSGCKYGTDKNGNPFVVGWKYDKRNGLRSFLCVPYSKTKAHNSKIGREWHNWMCKISCEGKKVEIVGCLYDVVGAKVIIKDLSYVLNPKARNGGYVGSYIYKNG